LVATIVFGYGLGLVLSATNLWVGEVAALRRAAALSILNLAWGVGAIACPALVMLAQGARVIGLLLFTIAGLALVHCLALLSINVEPRTRGSEEPKRTKIEIRSVVGTVAILWGLFFLYCGTETAVGGWAAMLAKRVGTKPNNWWELAP